MSETTGTHYNEADARAAGVQVEQPVLTDYWGFQETSKHFLPDHEQYFILQRMNEGAKAKYQRDTRSDITIQRASGDAKMKADPASERHALLRACVVGWHMFRPNGSGGFQELPWQPAGGQYSFEKWLSVADPKIVEDLEKACRKLNPWLLAEMSVEDIDREIENLKEMRAEAEKREAGE